MILHVSCRSKKTENSGEAEKQRGRTAGKRKLTNKKQKFRTAKKQRAEKQEKNRKAWTQKSHQKMPKTESN